MQESDIVYFVAGSRGKDLLQTDAFGAVKTMIAAEKSGIKLHHVKFYLQLGTL